MSIERRLLFDDADVLFAEFSAKGAHIRSPPENFSWAYEFEVENRNVSDITMRFVTTLVPTFIER